MICILIIKLNDYYFRNNNSYRKVCLRSHLKLKLAPSRAIQIMIIDIIIRTNSGNNMHGKTDLSDRELMAIDLHVKCNLVYSENKR